MFEREDFLVAVDRRSFTVTLLSPPPAQLAAEPALLMAFAFTRPTHFWRLDTGC